MQNDLDASTWTIRVRAIERFDVHCFPYTVEMCKIIRMCDVLGSFSFGHKLRAPFHLFWSKTEVTVCGESKTKSEKPDPNKVLSDN